MTKKAYAHEGVLKKQLFPVQLPQVAKHQLALFVAQVHAVALAVAKEGAVGTQAFLHPRAVAERTVAVVPHVHEVVAIDVSLMKITPDAGAGRQRAVYQDGSHAEPGVARVEMVAHPSLVAAEESLAAVAQVYASLASGQSDEFHQAGKFFARETEVGVQGGASGGKDGEDTPSAHAERNQKVAQFGQPGVVSTIDAGHHVPRQFGFFREQTNGLHGMKMALRMAAQPVVIVFKSVETDGDGVHPARHEPLQTPGVQVKTVGNHAPWIAATVEFEAHLFEVRAHQRLASGEDDAHPVGVDVRSDAVYCPQEVFGGHVGNGRSLTAIAPAVLAVQVATQRTLPEKLSQRVQFFEVAAHPGGHFKPQTAAQAKFAHGLSPPFFHPFPNTIPCRRRACG